jgi:hypothetical protein
MAIEIFRNRDDDYLAWRNAHPKGFVVNVVESDPTGSRLHKVSCVTLQRPIDEGKDLTGPYPKVCSDHLTELRRVTGAPRACGTCSP